MAYFRHLHGHIVLARVQVSERHYGGLSSNRFTFHRANDLDGVISFYGRFRNARRRILPLTVTGISSRKAISLGY